MGIPFYFRKLILTFGNQIVKRIKLMEECDSLYLDFNSMIHQHAHEVITKNPQIEEIEEYYPLVANALIDGIINICNIVRPRKRLYIAIDGMCPRAKMQQQRKRRYMTIWRNRQDPAFKATAWDSNVITPGTDFMAFLDGALEDFITVNKTRLGFEIVLSKSSDPGEGEHKMFQVMEEGEDAVIYGLDADLIMLSMISPNHKNIRLLREQSAFGTSGTSNKTSFSFLDIYQLRTLLFQEYSVPICDYVMLCVLLGNDFLPPLSYLSMRGNGVEHLIEAYKQANATIIQENGDLDFKTLANIFTILAKNEDERMASACELYYTLKPQQKSIDCYPQYSKCKCIINPNIDPNWRDLYYKDIVKGDKNNACYEYVRGLEWVFRYYFTKDASTTWYYPYSYSPSIKDLQYQSLYVPELEPDMSGLDPKLQLLLVLPPQSVNIMRPKSFQSFVTALGKGTTHLYPIDFNISTFLKTYLWECCPVLPNIDVEYISGKLIKD